MTAYQKQHKTNMDKIEKIRQESEELYARIDECINTLIKARLNKDTDGEGKSLFQMEGLMVGTQQFLCWISDTLSEESDKSLEEAANKFANQDCVTFISRKKGFIAGAEWQKKQGTFMGPIHEKCSQCSYDGDVVFLKGMQYAYDKLKEYTVEGTVTERTVSDSKPETFAITTKHFESQR